MQAYAVRPQAPLHLLRGGGLRESPASPQIREERAPQDHLQGHLCDGSLVFLLQRPQLLDQLVAEIQAEELNLLMSTCC